MIDVTKFDFPDKQLSYLKSTTKNENEIKPIRTKRQAKTFLCE